MTERDMVRDLISRGYPLLTIAREIEVDYYRLRRWLMSGPGKVDDAELRAIQSFYWRVTV